MKRKKVLSIVTAGLMVLSLAACGSGTTDNTASGGSASTSSTAKSSSSSDSGSTDSGNTDSSGKKVIEFYGWLDEEGIFTQLADAYKEKNPDVDFNLHFVPSADYETKLLTAFSGGADIDCFIGSTPWVMANYQSKDQLMDITDMMTETGIDTSGNQSFVDTLKIDDRSYALPYKTGSIVVYYNKDIFDAAGVDYPSDHWTWDEYFETAKQLTSGEGADKVYGSLNYQPTNMWWRFMATSDGHIDPMIGEDLDAWMDAAEFSLKLSQEGYQPSYADRSDEAGADYTGAFLQGKYGMMVNGEWCVEMLNTAMSQSDDYVNYDIAVLPHHEGGEQRSNGSAACIMMPASSRYPEETLDFMEFVAGEEGAEILVRNNYIPTWQTDEIVELFTKDVEVPEHLEYLITQEVIPNAPMDANHSAVQNVVKEEVSLYLLEEQDKETTTKNIQDRLTDEFDAVYE